MAETAVENEQIEQAVEAPSSAVPDEQLVAMPVERARNEGLQPTKRVLESALEFERSGDTGPAVLVVIRAARPSTIDPGRPPAKPVQARAEASVDPSRRSGQTPPMLPSDDTPPGLFSQSHTA